ncbi:MAG: phospholipase [Muribaculaceae bacterium]|nr:phospholipase [Muribaculaceae bacterium]
MIVALILLAAIIGGGLLLFLHDRYVLRPRKRRRGESVDIVTENPNADEDAILAHPKDGPVCCGMHVVCEKDSLSPTISTDIEYYDDEELYSYIGRPPESYTDGETDQFREILFTLLPSDIAGWARSLQLRGIQLPPAVRDELLLIVAEARAVRS